MADVFTLTLQVQGTEQLQKLEGVIKGVGKAGAVTESQLEQAAKQTDAIRLGFEQLAKQFKTSFEQLAQAIKGVNREMGGLDEAAKQGAAGAGKEIQQVGEKADKTAKSVRTLRFELQRRYETNTLLPTDPKDPAELRTAGVRLRPDDAVALRRMAQQTRATLRAAAEAQRGLQQIQVGRFRMMASTLAAEKRLQQESDRTAVTSLQRRLGLQLQMLKDAEKQKEQIQVGRFQMMGRMAEQARRQRETEEREAAREAVRARTLQNTALDRDAQYGGLTPQQQLARVERAQRRISLGNTDENDLLRRFGTQALGVARDANSAATLRAEVKALEDAAKAQREINRAKRDSEPESMRARVGVIGLAGAYDQLHATLRGGAGAMGAIWLTWGKQLTALWAGFAAVSALKQSIQQFAAFENTLTTIGAIAGETGVALRALGDSALEMSRNAIQGPQEVIDTLRIMTQAGLSAKDSLGQLRTVLDFATVGEMKPEAAAQSLVGVTSAFNFPIDQMGRVGDVIAKAAAISQTSIENMTSSIKVSSVVAEQYGAKIEDVGAILAVLAKRNIDATSAGTALRNAYTEIYTPTDKAKKALDALGLSAYDANTKQMKPFIQVMGEMRQAVIGLDKQSQNAFFQIIFGERGGKVGSALLNDMQGLEKAMRQVGNATNFVDEAAIRMQDSLQNKATIALNNLKASLIEAGAAAEGPLRQVLDSVASAFADPAFIDGVKTLAVNFAEFVKVVVDNADLIAKAFAVYLGSKAIGGMFEMGRAITAAAVAKRGLAEAAKDGTFSVAKLVDTAALASTRFGSLVASVGAVGTLVSGAGGAFLRFLGPIGLALTAVELASFAWDKYATSKAKALNAKPDEEAKEAKTAQEILKRERDRIAALENASEMKRLGAKPDDEQMNVFQRRVRDAQKLFDEAKGDEVKATRGRQLGAAFDELKQYEETVKRRRALEDANKLGQDLANTLPSGTLSRKFDELTGRGGNSYPSPLGTEAASILGKEKFEFDEWKRSFDRREQIINERRRANLINETQYNAQIENLTEERIKVLTEAAEDGLDKLPRLQQLRENDINTRVKDPVRREENLRAMRAQFSQLTTEWQGRVREVTADADNRLRSAMTGREGAQINRGLELAKQVDEWRRKLQEQDRDVGVDQAQFRENLGLEEQLRQAKNALEPMTDLERETAERRLAIVQRAAQKRAEYEKKYPLDFEKYVKQVNELEQQALATAEVIAQKQAQARTDPLVGVRASAVRMLGDAQNVAEQTGKAFENAFGSAESAVLDFVKTGKFSMRSFADTVMLEITRMGLNQMKAGALKWISGALGGVGFGPAGSGGPSWAQAVGSGTYPAMRSGGIVGAGGAMRSGDPSWWMGAPRYAKGGPVLEADAVPIIAHKGERVLTAEQNRAYESGMGGGVVVNQTINVQGGASTHDVVRAAQAAKQEAINAMMDAQRRGRRRP